MSTMTIKEAAGLLKVGEQTVRDMCRRGKIVAKKIPQTRKWLINTEELKKILP